MLLFVQTRQLSLPTWACYALSLRVLKRNALIAVIVGSILSFVNQYDAFSRHEFTLRLVLKLAFNYLIPFTVSIISALVNRRV